MPKTGESRFSRQDRTELKAERRVNEPLQPGRRMFERKPVTDQRVRGIRGDAGEGTAKEAGARNGARFFGLPRERGPVATKPSRKRNQ
jgi:hypothetical protein